MLEPWKQRARQLKCEIYTIYLAYQDSRTPWSTKVLAICVVGYALSPLDLIPDFIPILGYLDDLILLPLGIALVIRLIPPAVLEESRRKAQTTLAQNNPTSWVATALIVGIWLLLILLTGRLLWRMLIA